MSVNKFGINTIQKSILAIILLWAGTNLVLAQDEFITTWKTDNTGTSSSTEITIPTNSSYTYNYDVDWDNDGTFDEFGLTGDITHDFGTADTYTIRIQGTFPGIYFNHGGDKEKILSIENWGNITWLSMDYSFFGCSNLVINATDAPDITGVTSMIKTFRKCTSLSNEDLSGWNVSNVTSMHYLFSGSTFNGNISTWNVSSVSDFTYCFYQNTVFNSDISSWDVSGATDISSMFRGASEFNQDISNWDISNTTSLEGTFQEAKAFNQDLSGWNTASVTDMRRTFDDAQLFNSDISAWDVSAVKNMAYIFRSAYVFNQDISNWDISNVGSLEGAFKDARAFDQDLSGWNTASVTDMTQTFLDAHLFNSDISAWDVSGVTTMLHMFKDAYSFDQDLGNWDISNLTNATSMFDNSGLSKQNYDLILNGWGAQNVQTGITFTGSPSGYCHGESYRDTLINTYGWIISDGGQACTSTDYLTTTWKTDNSGHSNSTSIFIKTFNSYSYNYDVDWDNDGVFDEFGITGSVYHDFGVAGTYSINIRGTFPGMYFNDQADKNKLISIDNWGSIVWESMESSFYGCENLTINAADAPDITNVTSMQETFRYCTSLSNDDLSAWNVSNVTTMSHLFYKSTFNGNISTWDVSSVTNLIYTFGLASNFDQDLGNWDITSVTDANGMFYESGLSTQNYDQILIGWGAQNVKSGISFSGSSSGYCHGNNYRSILKNTYGWTIFDGGRTCSSENYFITTWQTDNTGTSGDTEITIPTHSEYTYLYDIDWDNDGVFDETGITGDVTHDFGIAGTYTIQIRGDFPAITFAEDGNCLKLISIDQWGTITWQSMDEAYSGCENMICNAIDAPDLSEISSLNSMFSETTSLTGDFSSWDVSSITDFSYMFNNSSFNGDISLWDLTSAINLTGMFSRSSFNGDISQWDVSNVTNLTSVFYECNTFNQDLGSWDVSNVTKMYYTFYKATSFDQDLGNWDVSSLTNASNMLNGVTLSTANYDSLLIGWGAQNVQPNVKFHAGNSNYCAGAAYRDTLILNNGWTITDGSLETEAPVPDEVTLDDITAECEVTSLTAPTATNCVGTINGTHDVSLPITTQGITVVTWTYDDGNGNTSTQTQNVVIEDVTSPTIICPDDQVISANNGTSYLVEEGEFELISFDDNCSQVSYYNDFNYESGLNGAELPLGENYITWTIEDGAGNTSTCSHKVTVSVVTGLDENSQLEGVIVYPNPAKDVIYIKGVKASSTNKISLSILNITGIPVMQVDHFNGEPVHISSLSTGIYIIQIKEGDHISSFRIIKK